MATLKQRGKNRASAYTCDGVIFDSQEEIEFYLFLKDCLRLGLIESFEYQPEAFELIPKAEVVEKIPYKKKEGFKTVKKVLYQGHSYTADWVFKIKPKFLQFFPNHGLRISKRNLIYIDIKGAYNRFGGDRIFPINAKLLFQVHKIHVNKLIPVLFFQKIGCAPDELRWMKNRKVKTLKKNYRGIKSLDEICGKKKRKVNNTTSNTETEVDDTLVRNIPFLPE